MRPIQAAVKDQSAAPRARFVLGNPVLRAACQATVRALEGVHGNLIDALDEDLFDYAEKRCLQHEQLQFFSLLRTLRRGKATMLGVFEEQITTAFVAMTRLPAPTPLKPDTPRALDTIIRWSARRNQAALGELCELFGVLTGRIRIEPEINPVSPRVIGNALMHAMADVLEYPACKKLFYSLAKDIVFGTLDVLYAALLRDLRKGLVDCQPPVVAQMVEVNEDCTPSVSDSDQEGLMASARPVSVARQRIIDARNVANERIDRALHDQEPHPFVSELLAESWTNVLTIVYLKEGTGGDAWGQAMKLIDDLLWTVEPKRTAADVARLQSMLPELSKILRDGLDRVAYMIDEIDHVFDELKRIYRESLPEVYRDKLHMPSARASRPLMFNSPLLTSPVAPKTRPVESVESSYLAERVEKLERGDWVEFVTQDGGKLKAKVSWRSPISRKLLFVNAQGIKVADKNEAELVEEVRRGEATIVDPVVG